MKLNENFVIHTIGDETMLIPTAAASFHGLGEGNRTVGFILNRLTQDTTEEEITDALAAEFIGDREEMAQDVRAIIEKLRAIGAIDE
ncbi:MAG: PqqD family protein [Ruminococcus sp.]|nr:PqqD family protein [Ruminococcus sp.]